MYTPSIATAPRLRSCLVFRVAALLALCVLANLGSVAAQAQVPADRVLRDGELFTVLKKTADPALTQLTQLYQKGGKRNQEKAKKELANYFRQKAAQRYYFNWQHFDDRLADYLARFPDKKAAHPVSAHGHMDLYPAQTNWKLPFKNLKGEAVNAYAVRHLSRQHKAPDMALSYFITQDERYINYFTEQVASLNTAFNAHKVETLEDGNGTYEAFRGGNRMLNWLFAHHAFLASDQYSDDEQLLLIRTFLHHAAFLYRENQQFSYGNHQTKGMTALAMIAILFPEVEGADKWYAHAMKLLGEHLEKEVNPDGFQFERTVHYHIGDIDNYFMVYQLARKNNMPVDAQWAATLQRMFTALAAIALPNKNGPVLQDDTDEPWATQNEIGEAMLLGYLLFRDPAYGYFASAGISSEYYWYTPTDQLDDLKNIRTQAPAFTSTALPETGYYVMRDGWNPEDMYMVISTGVSKQKPDHQHGDVLGVQAYAYGVPLLPNYQVRYSLPDLELFKNSWVKNVALADSMPQGQKWKGNEGGSGFGKFAELPQANVKVWLPAAGYDLFIGSHNGFQKQAIRYTRKVLFLKDEFWIVKDEFQSPEEHRYQQVWQGNYSLEDAPALARANFGDATGLDILQLTPVKALSLAGNNGKNRVVYQAVPAKNFTYLTVLRPYKGYSNRIASAQSPSEEKVGDWQVFAQNYTAKDSQIRLEAAHGLAKKGAFVLFGCRSIQLPDLSLTLDAPRDIMLALEGGTLTVTSLSAEVITLTAGGKKQEKYTLPPAGILQVMVKTVAANKQP
ncbi:heparinase II/III family protein [Pontibacter sp. E15-1]|uniref:heparinase II/III family protein n=1 Tax=Pontibacter sp. E15-1 TaxID=2919918 RepID=UPI001F4F31C6|nr:heparinase II/III family protein [Pontibacter sp. E15-1]MCJ8163228.1 heparinase II/III family protein [Pontibacter sp. E15-1]